MAEVLVLLYNYVLGRLMVADHDAVSLMRLGLCFFRGPSMEFCISRISMVGFVCWSKFDNSVYMCADIRSFLVPFCFSVHHGAPSGGLYCVYILYLFF